MRRATECGSRRRAGGFTLIELLTTVAIIVVILTLAAPSFTAFQRNSELTGVANTIVASTFSPYEVFIMAALIYLTITLVITRCFKYLEYALGKHQRPLKSTAAIPGQVRHAD